MIKIKRIILILIITLLATISNAFADSLYSIDRNQSKISLNFKDRWRFSRISIPMHSFKFWGNNDTHNAAIIIIGNEKHIVYSKNGSKYLDYLEKTMPTNCITIVSLNTSSDETEETAPYFTAVLEETQKIETEIDTILNNETDRLNKNRCFSCHTAIPTATVIKEAQNKGFKINKESVTALLNQYSQFQNENGSFYFEQEPTYGVKTTTLSGVFIISLLSDFMRKTFEKVAIKAMNYLSVPATSTTPICSDFIFEPFFNDTTTPILFESMILKELYLMNPVLYKNYHQRMTNLSDYASKLQEEQFLHMLVVYCGIPYCYQLKPEIRNDFINKLVNHIETSKNIRQETSKALCTAILSHYFPTQLPEQQKIDYEINSDSYLIIWKCLEEILYNSPKYIDGNCYE